MFPICVYLPSIFESMMILWKEVPNKMWEIFQFITLCPERQVCQLPEQSYLEKEMALW